MADRRPGPAWLSRHELAGVLEISITGLERQYLRHLAADDRRRCGRRVYFRAMPVLERWADKRATKRATNGTNGTTTSTDDPIFAGPKTPALERWRAARAEGEELSLAERKRELMPRDQVHDGLVLLANMLRDMGDEIERGFGNEAGDLVRETLDSWLDVVEQRFGDGEETTHDT